MAGHSLRWRTTVEVAVISVVIYIFLGTPGLELSSSHGPTAQQPNLSVPTARAKIEQLVYPSPDLECAEHGYEVHVFSTSPLVIYIDNFLSPSETDHLIEASHDRWAVSTVFNAGHETVDAAVRRSEQAALPRSPTVQCIERRALAFQGWPAATALERLRTQRYNASGHYALHHDWATAGRAARRVSTFMVYLRGDCVGGGTHFPRLERPAGAAEWCEYVECEEGAIDGVGGGVTFKPRRGSAVFWMNFDAEGRGYKETLHAGMPVVEGQKIGLNIWSWYQAGLASPGVQE